MNPAEYSSERYLEACCLEALMRDRDKWATRMSASLFTGPREPIYAAIMDAEDPSDPAQLVTGLDPERQEWSELGDIIGHQIEAPVGEQGILWRLERLVGLHARRDLRQALGEASRALDQDTGSLDVVQSLQRRMEALSTDASLLGPFAESKPLSEAVTEPDEEIESICRKILYPQGMTCLAGPGGLGKSWLAIWLGLQIARGEFYLGFQCSTKRVGYISLEMPSSLMRHRIKLLTSGKFPFDAMQRFIYLGNEATGRSVDVLDEKFRLNMAAWVADKKLDVLILDPLKNAHSVDENSATEMGKVLAALSQAGCAVLFVHHVDKARGETRGSSAIRDWCDVVLNLSSRNGEGLRLGWEKRPRFEEIGGDINVDFFKDGDSIRIERA